MLAYPKLLLKLVFFKEIPQHFPRSKHLLGFLLVVNLLMRLRDFSPPYEVPAAVIVFGFAIMAIFVWFSLKLSGHSKVLFIPVLNAIYSILFFQLLLMQPLIAVLPENLLERLNFASLIWMLAVLVHIIRCALRIELWEALLWVVTYEVLRLACAAIFLEFWH